MKKTIYTLLLLFLFAYGNAQDSSKAFLNARHTKPTVNLSGHQNAIEVGVGTLGIAADYQHRFTKVVAIRLGGSYLPPVKDVDMSDIVTISSKSKTKMDVNFSSVHLLVEFSPFGGNAFRLVTGVGYFTNASAILNTYFDSSISITATKSYSPDEVGNVITTIDYKCLAPYIGFGLGRGVPKHRVGLNFDFGTYYLKAPTVTVVGTKLLADNSQLGPAIQTQLESYVWLPVFQLNLNVRL